MRKIKVDLLGGLGNQLYGLALALALVSQTKSTRLTLSDRLIPFGSNPSRRLVVNQLGLSQNNRIQFVRTNSRIAQIIGRGKALRRIWWKITRMKEQDFTLNAKSIWSPSPNIKDKLVFSDYFNDWFFAELALKHEALSNFPNLEITSRALAVEEENLKKEHDTFLHIRLGDYLDYPEIFQLLPEEYYFGALKELQSGMGVKRKFNIVSESAKEVHIYYPKLAKLAERIIDNQSGMSDIETFKLMCDSKSLIAANSTFSIWAAWFVQSNGGSAVVPVENLQVAGEQGFIYLNWKVFNLSTEEFMEMRSSEKTSWIAYKREQLDKLIQLLESKEERVLN